MEQDRTEPRRETIELPFPPSLNNYYTPHRMGGPNGRVSVGLTKAAKEYRVAVLAALLQRYGVRSGIGRPETCEPLFDCRVEVAIEFHAPTRASRDLDNYLKGLFDGLTHANFWTDDRLVDVLAIRRGPIVKGGRIDLVVTEIPEVLGGLFGDSEKLSEL